MLHPPATAPKISSMPRPKPATNHSQRLNPWELPVSLPLRGVPATITDRMRELYGRCEVMKQNYETHAQGLFNKQFERQESHPHVIPETVRKSIDLKRPSMPNVALDMAVRQPLATKVFDFPPQREAANCSRVSANPKPDTSFPADGLHPHDGKQNNSMENLLRQYIELGNAISGVPEDPRSQLEPRPPVAVVDINRATDIP